ncbi:hypothetical protein DPF_0799 [Desulfoplanes formicivorans]|uniref:Uncharacterized protein n=1 Tax=Desulfoplanes formicivorans TaxID=1592317 RepID=A0A194ADD2_9BACT|nr:hypothetical protein DPF_0799 [Desulfoplanes formicivorans]
MMGLPSLQAGPTEDARSSAPEFTHDNRRFYLQRNNPKPTAHERTGCADSSRETLIPGNKKDLHVYVQVFCLWGG